MDASHDVVTQTISRRHDALPQPAQEPSAAVVREQIYATLGDLHEHIEELQGYVHRHFGSAQNPFHMREKIAAHPLGACAAALAIGVFLGGLGATRGGLQVIRHTTRFASGVMAGIGRNASSEIIKSLIVRGL